MMKDKERIYGYTTGRIHAWRDNLQEGPTLNFREREKNIKVYNI
jgi:hypothetical protein